MSCGEKYNPKKGDKLDNKGNIVRKKSFNDMMINAKKKKMSGMPTKNMMMRNNE
jgi:hypothetical protein